MKIVHLNVNNEYRVICIISILSAVVSVALAIMVPKFLLSAVLGVVTNGLVLAAAHKNNVKHALWYGLVYSVVASIFTCIGTMVAHSYMLSIIIIFLFVPFVIIIEYNEGAKTLVILSIVILVVMMGVPSSTWLIALQKTQYFFVGSFVLFLCCWIVKKIAPSLFVTDLSFCANRLPAYCLDRSYVVMAIIVTISVALAHSIAIYYTLGFGYWIPMTVVLIFKKEQSLTTQRSKHRIIGTLLGVVFSAPLIVGTNEYHFLSVLLIPILVYCCVMYYVYHYGYYTFFITLLIVDLYRMALSDTHRMYYDRIIDTFIAAGIVVFFTYCAMLFNRKDNSSVE